ncbi:hypothetical protein [Corynebacterium falsenii]|uniref:hypothetical protein n=1 Tax=Corynebacterium falsenii TaxID=108486 RepID=UPI0011C226DF|nr:hypothetical protein [Corynebacterium falsenii]
MTKQTPSNSPDGNNPGYIRNPVQAPAGQPAAWPQPQEPKNSTSLSLIVSLISGVLAVIAFWFAASSDRIGDLVSLSALTIVLTLVSCTGYLGSKLSK